MKAGRKNLEAGDQLVQKHRSSYGAFRKRDEKLGIKKTSSCGEVTGVNGIPPLINSSENGGSSSIISKKIRKKKPSLLQKAEKTVKRLEIEVAETRGYTKCMKELATNEATVLGIAVEAKVNQMKRMNIILSSKNQIINRFVTGMLAVFEAEDQLANLIP